MKIKQHVSLLALALLAACGGGGDAKGGPQKGAANANEPDVPQAQRYGGTIVVGAIGAIPDMNPLTSSDNTGNQVQQYVLFMPLITYNEKFEPIPWLARSWEVNADTTVLTFHLRNDVFWHDGVKTTAYDVKYSYDMAREPKTLFPNTAFWTHYGDATVVDSFTIQIGMRPHADFMDPWRSFSPVPKHILEGTAPSAMQTHPFNTRNPVGNGPFKFVEHVQGQRWVFAANENFPKELGGRPYADRLVYRIIPEPTTLMAELLRGNLDYYIAPTAEQAEQIEASPEARILSFPDRQFLMIGWNEKREMFQDVRVRRALTMALDRKAIVQSVRRGYGELGNSTIPPIFWNHDPQAGADLQFDTAGAKRLLAEAGWQDRNGDGILEDARGRPFSFTMITNQGNREREDIAVIVQSQLRKVGIDARTQLMEWGSLLDRIQDVDKRDYDAVIIAWVTEFRIDDTDLFHCDKLRDPYQWVSYCNPETDRLLDTLPTLVDRNVSGPVWKQYQRQIAEQQPYTILYFTRRLEGVHERLRNVNPDARGDWVNIRQWYLLPNMRANR
ncbi:MAG TPA: ABC transporter substrate-binding protein [Longimicrobium sp.]|nr:ABC transporter substrate-binding protein [Longimicrobium sp.]